MIYHASCSRSGRLRAGDCRPGRPDGRIVGEAQLANPYVVFFGITLLGIVAVIADLLTPRKRIQAVSAIYIGMIVGIFLSYLLQNALRRPCSSTCTSGSISCSRRS